MLEFNRHFQTIGGAGQRGGAVVALVYQVVPDNRMPCDLRSHKFHAPRSDFKSFDR